MKRYFITGIGTGVGKTIVSAILTEALHADYWKPVQAGIEGGTDTELMKSLVSNKETVFHPETYLLQTPASPHYAAALEHVSMNPPDFIVPQTSRTLLIEGAGGLLVPLDRHFLVIDLIGFFGAEAILVSQHYLGSINHTLLSVEALKQRNIPVKGIIFNGKPNKATEDFILEYTQLPCLFRLNMQTVIDREMVLNCAQGIDTSIF
jgi:dethiobiotin synthetase